MSIEQAAIEVKEKFNKMSFDDLPASREVDITPIQPPAKPPRCKKITVYLTQQEFDMFTEMWLAKAAINGKSERSALMGEIVQEYYNASRRN